MGFLTGSAQRIGLVVALSASVALTGCGRVTVGETADAPRGALVGDAREERTTTLAEAFRRNRNQESIVKVNKYIWRSSLEVLDFLPIQTVDPFTGVIVTGYGTPPGGGRSYRATVLISDPALDARSLNVALQTRGGPASASTVRAVEDAILTRARQLRITDNRF